MSAQCRHGLIRYECWKCRDEANQSTHVAHVFAGGLVTAVQQLEAKDAEIARLRQDLAAARARVAELEGERDIWNKECDRREDDRIKAEQRTDFARQRAERAEAELATARATIDTMQGGYDRAAAMIIDLRRDLAAARADYQALANSESTSAQQLRKDLAAARALLREASGWLGDNDAEESLIRRIDAALAEERNHG